MEAFIDLFFATVFATIQRVLTTAAIVAVFLTLYRYVTPFQEAFWSSALSRPSVALISLVWSWWILTGITEPLLGGWPGSLAPFFVLLFYAKPIFKSFVVVASVKVSVVILDNLSMREQAEKKKQESPTHTREAGAIDKTQGKDGPVPSGRLRVVNGMFAWKFPDPWETLEERISTKDEETSGTIWFDTSYKWQLGVEYTITYQRDTRQSMLDRAVELEKEKIDKAIAGLIKRVFAPMVTGMDPEKGFTPKKIRASQELLTEAVAGTDNAPLSAVEEEFAIRTTSVSTKLVRHEKHQKTLRLEGTKEKFKSGTPDGSLSDKEAYDRAFLNEEEKGAVKQTGVVVHGTNLLEQLASLLGGLIGLINPQGPGKKDGEKK